jgi:dipeptidyl aminopeptidase/acylaminoacyl peptidase
MRPVLLVTLSLFAAALPAQKKFVLSIDSFTRGPALAGYPPSDVRWSGDSRRLYFQWKQPTDPVLKPADTYVVERDGSGLRKLSEEEARLAPSTLGDTSKDRKQTVFTRDGDIFLYDRPSGNTRRITRTGDAEASPRFTRDGRRVWFTRGGNLYTLSLDGGMLEQLTDIRSATTASSPAAPPAAGLGFGFGQGRGAQQQSQSSATGEPQRGTDSQEYIKKEERELLDIVRQKAAIREENEARRKREHPRKPYTLQARQTVGALSLSPDEKTVIASVLEPGERARNTIVPNYITESAYTEDISSRGKAGDTQGRSRLAIIDVETGDSRFVDISHISALPKSGTTPKPEVPKPSPDPSADSGQARRPAAPPTRDIQLAQPVWSDDGSKAVLMARAADNKDRWILALDPATGKTRTLVHDHDDAWIGGPGMFTLGWLANNQDVYFQSERTGYSHLYLVSHDGGEPRPLTSGNWEVHTVRLSEDKSTLYLTTNEGDPSQVHLYSLPAQGGPRVKITTRIGHHAITLSPDEKWIADIYSYTNRPPELYVMENRGGADQKKLTSSPTEEFRTYDWREPPIIKIRARDGVEVPARLYKPANFRKGGPAVIFVHGAGYLQNVHRWWQQYYREYMFHHLLMERGYIVIDADYRGSAGYGRDWRTAIYRHMGGRDLDDQVDAARWLVSQHGVDPKRIGLYGGSYGGFITLMAMFTQPDVFAAGAALRPVTDWAHYNNGYTGNILNVPQRDAEAYKRSSPIYFANGLKGALLICHGMVDTNVHFQDTVRLVQKLIELGKENWELAVFPVEDHAFAQPSSWADEYKRIFKLFEQNLRLKP